MAPDKGCLPGTRKNTLEKLSEWVNDTSQSRVLFLLGGAGKSAIAHTIARLFSNRLRAFFRFDRNHLATNQPPLDPEPPPPKHFPRFDGSRARRSSPSCVDFLDKDGPPREHHLPPHTEHLLPRKHRVEHCNSERLASSQSHPLHATNQTSPNKEARHVNSALVPYTPLSPPHYHSPGLGHLLIPSSSTSFHPPHLYYLANKAAEHDARGQQRNSSTLKPPKST
ncbi:hypothetical protein M422DRAFT_250272 [Sphaerobolus stellatus SS14]|uniref:Uncharacterized protein n=1 Tax=Sphaerobolus stellatus (strain SS14) TaxID=990650 RepID=A0A0C9W395_SPHS4|nr:hypothetical protein M422DRAFT_250272 [Sphaerobolus stellatus SS14]